MRLQVEVLVLEESIQQFEDSQQLCWSELHPVAELQGRKSNICISVCAFWSPSTCRCIYVDLCVHVHVHVHVSSVSLSVCSSICLSVISLACRPAVIRPSIHPLIYSSVSQSVSSTCRSTSLSSWQTHSLSQKLQLTVSVRNCTRSGRMLAMAELDWTSPRATCSETHINTSQLHM